MPTDLEVAEAEADEEQRSRKKPKSRVGLFVFIVVILLVLAGVSAILPESALARPWFAYPDGTVVEGVNHPHLRGTVYSVHKSHGLVRDEVFDRQGFSPATGLAFEMKSVMMGIRGYRSRATLPTPSSHGIQSTLVVQRYELTTSFALITGGGTNRHSKLAVFEHHRNPEAVYHTVTITGDAHLYPAIRGGGHHSSGGTMGITAATYDCPDPLAMVSAYYESTFKPTPAAPDTHAAALRIASVLNSSATDYTLLIQGDAGPVLIHAVEDSGTKKTHIFVVTLDR